MKVLIGLVGLLLMYLAVTNKLGALYQGVTRPSTTASSRARV